MSLLNRAGVTALVSLPDCVAAVEQGLGQHAEGAQPLEPGALGVRLPNGGLHIRTAALGGSPGDFAAKVNHGPIPRAE